jgi:hypothetical protein
MFGEITLTVEDFIADIANVRLFLDMLPHVIEEFIER